MIGLNYKIEQVIGLKRSSIQRRQVSSFYYQINIYHSEFFVAPQILGVY